MGLVNITDVQNGDDADQELFNSRFGAIIEVLNGNIDAANIADNSIGTGKVVNNAITAAKIEVQQDWQAVTYSNSWVDYDAAVYFGVQYYKDSLGIVHLRGMAKSGTTTTGTTMFTLPVGYRPARQMLVPTMSNAVIARVEVKVDGTVITGTGVNAAWVTFANIHFRAEG